MGVFMSKHDDDDSESIEGTLTPEILVATIEEMRKIHRFIRWKEPIDVVQPLLAAGEHFVNCVDSKTGNSCLHIGKILF